MLTSPRHKIDVLLVCSTGGHLLQLYMLREAWADMDCAWVTFEKSDSESLLAAEQVYFAHGPTNRDVRRLFQNLYLAWRLLRQLRPAAIVSTGAGVAVPFFWLAKLFRVRTVYIESLARIDQPSLTYRLIKPFVDQTYVQWPELLKSVPGARYVGGLAAE